MKTFKLRKNLASLQINVLIANSFNSGKQQYRKSIQQHLQRKQSIIKNIINCQQIISCSICRHQIRATTHIITESNKAYCIKCFCDKYIEYEQGNRSENYRVRNKICVPIFQRGWTIQEQLLMFEGLEKHGFGNWQQISKHFFDKLSGTEVKQHYFRIYLSSKDLLPNVNNLISNSQLTHNAPSQIQSNAVSLRQKKNKRKVKSNSKDNICKNTGLSKNKKNTTSKSIKLTKSTKKLPLNYFIKVLGYMPNRQDFQIQFDNQAEILLAELQFFTTDTHQQILEKQSLIQVYKQRVQNRNTRKKFVIQRQIIQAYNSMTDQIQIGMADGLTKSSRQQFGQKFIYQNLQVFDKYRSICRLMTAEEYETLLKCFLRQKMIIQKISELQYKKQIMNNNSYGN